MNRVTAPVAVLVIAVLAVAVLAVLVVAVLVVVVLKVITALVCAMNLRFYESFALSPAVVWFDSAITGASVSIDVHGSLLQQHANIRGQTKKRI